MNLPRLLHILLISSASAAVAGLLLALVSGSVLLSTVLSITDSIPLLCVQFLVLLVLEMVGSVLMQVLHPHSHRNVMVLSILWHALVWVLWVVLTVSFVPDVSALQLLGLSLAFLGAGGMFGVLGASFISDGSSPRVPKSAPQGATVEEGVSAVPPQAELSTASAPDLVSSDSHSPQ